MIEFLCYSRINYFVIIENTLKNIKYMKELIFNWYNSKCVKYFFIYQKKYFQATRLLIFNKARQIDHVRKLRGSSRDYTRL